MGFAKKGKKNEPYVTSIKLATRTMPKKIYSATKAEALSELRTALKGAKPGTRAEILSWDGAGYNKSILVKYVNEEGKVVEETNPVVTDA
jgi:hypothetical protein